MIVSFTHAQQALPFIAAPVWHHSVRARPIPTILAEWRAAERCLALSAAQSPERDRAQAASDRLRQEHRRAFRALLDGS